MALAEWIDGLYGKREIDTFYGLPKPMQDMAILRAWDQALGEDEQRGWDLDTWSEPFDPDHERTTFIESLTWVDGALDVDATMEKLYDAGWCYSPVPIA